MHTNRTTDRKASTAAGTAAGTASKLPACNIYLFGQNGIFISQEATGKRIIERFTFIFICPQFFLFRILFPPFSVDSCISACASVCWFDLHLFAKRKNPFRRAEKNRINNNNNRRMRTFINTLSHTRTQSRTAWMPEGAENQTGTNKNRAKTLATDVSPSTDRSIDRMNRNHCNCSLCAFRNNRNNIDGFSFHVIQFAGSLLLGQQWPNGNSSM